MRRIRNWFRSAMSQDRFSNLSILHIENDLTANLSGEKIVAESTYSLLHQCFMPNRYISLFKIYLTLLTSQGGALATDARGCRLWRSLLERLPPAPETRVRDPLGVMVRTRWVWAIIVFNMFRPSQQTILT